MARSKPRTNRGRPRRPPAAVSVAIAVPDDTPEQDQTQPDQDRAPQDAAPAAHTETPSATDPPDLPEIPEIPEGKGNIGIGIRERDLEKGKGKGKGNNPTSPTKPKPKPKPRAVQAEVLDALADTLKHCRAEEFEAHLTPDESRAILSALARDATREETRLRAIELDARIAGYQAPTRAVTGQFVFAGHAAAQAAQAEAQPAGLLAAVAGDPAALALRVEAWRLRRHALGLTKPDRSAPEPDCTGEER